MPLPLRPRPRRYPVIATVELTDMQSEAHMNQVISDLSLFGCHVSTQQMWPIGTNARVRIAHEDATFEAQARVVYGRPMLGMGILFTQIGPQDQEVLNKWIAALKGTMKK